MSAPGQGVGRMKRNKVAMAGLLALAAAVGSDLSWGETGFGAGRSMDSRDALIEARESEAPSAPELVRADYAAGNAPPAGEPKMPVEWVSIGGGKFMMGTDDDDDAKPIHEVDIPTFEMSKTAVTVEQYSECVTKGQCTQPDAGDDCNWGNTGRRRHPVNCVNWKQANQYAQFKGARLPSESEWEYAATSGGKSWKYPWGNEDATCERAVMFGTGGYGCGSEGTMPVCSKPAGNTTQGLCDMAGNVWQWVQDKYQSSYAGAPADGGAFTEASGSLRVIRGGSWCSAGYLRSARRYSVDPGVRGYSVGFRLAR